LHPCKLGQPRRLTVRVLARLANRSETRKWMSARDLTFKKTMLDRVRDAVEQTTTGAYESANVRGFDGAWLPKSRFFGRKTGPRLLVRIVAVADAGAVADAWIAASAFAANTGDDTCVMLMASSVAAAAELARAIAEQRRVLTGAQLTLIPMDVESWGAHVPTDAPQVARDILAVLRAGE
jgi:hypothetical protein